MKRVLALVLALIMTVGLYACKTTEEYRTALKSQSGLECESFDECLQALNFKVPPKPDFVIKFTPSAVPWNLNFARHIASEFGDKVFFDFQGDYSGSAEVVIISTPQGKTEGLDKEGVLTWKGPFSDIIWNVKAGDYVDKRFIYVTIKNKTTKVVGIGAAQVKNPKKTDSGNWILDENATKQSSTAAIDNLTNNIVQLLIKEFTGEKK